MSIFCHVFVFFFLLLFLSIFSSSLISNHRQHRYIFHHVKHQEVEVLLLQLDVHHALPHDQEAFTEGLCIDENTGIIFESRGLWGQSAITASSLSALIQQQGIHLPISKTNVTSIDPELFAEGLTFLPQEHLLLLLTYIQRIAMVYDSRTLKLLFQFTIPNVQFPYLKRLYDDKHHHREKAGAPFAFLYECWGLTHYQSTYFYVSDGSSRLFIFKRHSKKKSELKKKEESLAFDMAPKGYLQVHTYADVRFSSFISSKSQSKGQPILVNGLNELELIESSPWFGEHPTILANIYGSFCIVAISAYTGTVMGWILPPSSWKHKQQMNNDNDNLSVMNGIAYDSKKNALFVTGKQWPFLYEVGLSKMMTTNLSEVGTATTKDILKICNIHSKFMVS